MSQSIKMVKPNMYYGNNKDILKKKPYNNDSIYLVTQFFIHKQEERHKEILYCLKQNVTKKYFKKIILLNEKIYTHEEMGLTKEEYEDRVIQIDIVNRMKYSDVLSQVKKLELQGYIAISNSDIFFDESIKNVRKSCLSQRKSVYALLRYEFNTNRKLSQCKLFTFPNSNQPRYDSQDVWIYHTSKMVVNEAMLESSNIELGKPGCDNKISWVFNNLGYICYNVPKNVKTYHYHTTQIRNYGRKDVIPGPYLWLETII